MTEYNRYKNQSLGLDLSKVNTDSVFLTNDYAKREIHTTNLFDNIEDVADDTKEIEQDKSVENNNNEDNQKEDERPSYYEIHNPSDKKGIIAKYITDIITWHRVDYSDRCPLVKERSHQDIVDIISENNDTDIRDMARHVARFDEFKYTGDGESEYFEKLLDGKSSKGSVDVDKYDLILNYEINEKGIVKFTKLSDLHNYLEDDANITDDLSDWEEVSLEVIDALAKVYPIFPNSYTMIMDFKLIRDALIETTHKNYTIRDVVNVFRYFTDAGWIIPIDTRINNGFENYKQSVIISNNQIPVLGYYGRVTSKIEIQEKQINSKLSLFNSKWNINVPCIAKIGASAKTFLLADGVMGILNDGVYTGIKINPNSINGNVKFDIYRITNVKKETRFKENLRLKKALNPKAKGNYESSKYEDNIKCELLQEGVKIDQSIMLNLYGLCEKGMNMNGGSFTNAPTSTDVSSATMYNKDTLWGDFSVDNRLNGETDDNYSKRLLSVSRMNTRLKRNTRIFGIHSTKESEAYARSYLNDVNGVPKDLFVKTLDQDRLQEIEVTKLDGFDMIYSFEKAISTSNNNKIRRSNKDFTEMLGAIKCKRETIDTGKYVEHINDRGISVEQIVSKDKFMKERWLKPIFAQAEMFNWIPSEELKKMLKQKSYKDIIEEYTELYEKYGNDIPEKIKPFISPSAMLEDKEDCYENQYRAERQTFMDVLSNIQTYEYVNTLNFKVKKYIFNLVSKYNKLTGNNIKIQNFKVQVVDLASEVIAEGKQALKEIDKSNKELRNTLKDYLKETRRLRRILKRDIYNITKYNDYETNKTKICLDSTCNNILGLTESLKSMQIDNYMDMSKLDKLIDYIKEIQEHKYEIADGISYSKSIYTLKNKCASLTTKLDFYRDMYSYMYA